MHVHFIYYMLYYNGFIIVLGPLLFIIYVNDIYSAIHNSQHGMFADDLALYREIRTLDNCELLQNDLVSIASWSQQWQLQLNWNKCEAINITNKQTLYYFHIIFIIIPFDGALKFAIWVLSLTLT